MKHVALVAVCACASGHRGDGAQLVRVEPRPPVHAAHGGTIVQVAITDDGQAAVSQDEFGGARLWPALDGRVEPVAFAMPVARELAIVHDGTGYAIALIDEAGTLEVIDLTAGGRERSRTQPATEVERISAIDGGVVALRADQTLVDVDPHGRVVAQLAAPPGRRIASVIARHGRVLALLTGKQVRGRWIDLAQFAWGAETPPLAGDPPEAELSPDGATLALGSADGVRIVTLATGQVRARGLCPAAMLGVAGFVDASTIACLSEQVEWFGFDGKPSPEPGPATRSTQVAAVGDGVALAAVYHHLALRTATGAHYLGYGYGEIGQVRATASGLIIAAAEGAPLELDRELVTHQVIDLPRGAASVVLQIDDRYVMTSMIAPFGDHVALYDLHAGTVQQELSGELRPASISYDPGTHLLVGLDDAGAVVRRYDPATARFGDAVHLAAQATRIELLDPALAAGDAVAVLRSRDHMVEVTTYRDADLRGAHVEPRRTFMTFDPVHAIDRAGRVVTQDGDQLVIDNGSASGLAGRFGAVAGLRQVAPGPNGAQIAVLTDTTLAMYDGAGKPRWQVPVHDALHVVWAGDAPYLQLATALVRFDPATGEAAMRGCGWGFALSDEVPREALDLPSVCDAP